MVDYIEEDHFVYGGSTRQTMSWGLDRIDNNSNRLDQQFDVPCEVTGRGVDVYVLDTGINYHHKEFSSKVRYSGSAYHRYLQLCLCSYTISEIFFFLALHA